MQDLELASVIPGARGSDAKRPKTKQWTFAATHGAFEPRSPIKIREDDRCTLRFRLS